jgi:transposase
MAQAYLTQGYTLAEIGQAVGLHYATISRIITALEKTSACKMGPLLFDPLSDPLGR